MAKVKKKKEELKYYSLEKILEKNVDYNFFFGEVSKGKTYSALEYAIKQFAVSGYKNQTAIVRRWQEYIKGQRAETIYNG